MKKKTLPCCHQNSSGSHFHTNVKWARFRTHFIRGWTHILQRFVLVHFLCFRLNFMRPNVCWCLLSNRKKNVESNTQVNSLITNKCLRVFLIHQCAFFCIIVNLHAVLNKSFKNQWLHIVTGWDRKKLWRSFQSYSIMMFLSVTFPCTLQKGKVEDCSVWWSCRVFARCLQGLSWKQSIWNYPAEQNVK